MPKGTLYTISGAAVLALSTFVGRWVWNTNADVVTLKAALAEKRIIDLNERVLILENESENQWALLRDLNDGVEDREVEVKLLNRINTSLVLPFISGKLSEHFEPSNPSAAVLYPDVLAEESTTQPMVPNRSVAPHTAVAPNAAVIELKETIDDAKAVTERRKRTKTAEEFRNDYTQQRILKSEAGK